MLFYVISEPPPERPDDVKAARDEFRRWIERLKKDNKVRSFHLRAGRGAVVLFDAASNEELHELLTQWSNIVPARHDVYPVIDPAG